MNDKTETPANLHIDLDYAAPRRPQPVRICGESEARVMSDVYAQAMAEQHQRLRGRFVHRHKGKSLRRHRLRPDYHRLKFYRARVRRVFITKPESAQDGVVVTPGFEARMRTLKQVSESLASVGVSFKETPSS